MVGIDNAGDIDLTLYAADIDPGHEFVSISDFNDLSRNAQAHRISLCFVEGLPLQSQPVRAPVHHRWPGCPDVAAR